MQEFFSTEFYGNTVQQWLFALLIIVAAAIIAKTIYWLINKFVKRATKKSKTKLDDIIIDMLEEPVIFAVIIGGLWFSIKSLILPENILQWAGNVFHILIALNIAWLVSRLVDSLIQEYLTPLVKKTDGDLDDQLLPIIRKSIKGIIWAIGIIVGLNNAVYDIAALLAGLGIGGLAFALAAQDSVSNLFGGFMIFVDKPFIIKDRVKVSGIDGVVEEVGIRSTRIRTLAGRIVVIPNSAFIKNNIENISSEPNRKIVLNLGLTYDMNEEKITQAIKILKKITAAHSSLEEKTLCSFNGFGDFSLNILLIYYIKKGEDILETQTEINLEILKQFNQAGLEFAFPTQTIFTQAQQN
ncbi:MAG: transporter [Bacteroidia bacterium]|nr:MAG: transporter [Bacteroidia bacterium]